MKAKTVELHLLQSFPPSCLNRDGNNSPKDCTFGDSRRAAVLPRRGRPLSDWDVPHTSSASPHPRRVGRNCLGVITVFLRQVLAILAGGPESVEFSLKMEVFGDSYGCPCDDVSLPRSRATLRRN